MLQSTGPFFSQPLFNPFTAAFRADPYPIYHRVRAADPVHIDANHCWNLTRFRDISQVLRSPEAGHGPGVPSEQLPPGYAQYRSFYRMLDRWMFTSDPPKHTRLRSMFNKSFTPQTAERLRPKVQAITDELIDAALRRGRMDVISDLAFPLPVMIIGELLGIPEQDRGRLRSWSNALVRANDMTPSHQDLVRGNQAAEEFSGFLTDLMGQRQKQPRDDLLSSLVRSAPINQAPANQQKQPSPQTTPLRPGQPDGTEIAPSMAELVANCIFLLVSGHETTSNLIGNGIYSLLRNPEQLGLLRNNPRKIRPAIQELLRFDSPVQMTFRLALEEINVGAKTIPRGSRIILWLGAGNRDPAKHSDPDRLDISRQDTSHLSFSEGIHTCIGAPLACIEGEIAIGTLIQRMPDLRLSNVQPQWLDENLVIRGLKSLPLG